MVCRRLAPLAGVLQVAGGLHVPGPDPLTERVVAAVPENRDVEQARGAVLERPREAVRDDRDVAVTGPSEPEPAVPAGADRAGPPQAVRPLHLPCLRLIAGHDLGLVDGCPQHRHRCRRSAPHPPLDQRTTTADTTRRQFHPENRLAPPTAGPVPSGAEHAALEAPGCSGCRSASQSTGSRPAGARSGSRSANSRTVPEAELHHVKATARTAAVEPHGP